MPQQRGVVHLMAVAADPTVAVAGLMVAAEDRMAAAVIASWEPMHPPLLTPLLYLNQKSG